MTTPSLERIPDALIAHTLSHLSNDPSSILAARSTCQFFREVCDLLSTQTCKDLAIQLTFKKNPHLYLVDENGCSSLLLSTSGIPRSISSIGKRRIVDGRSATNNDKQSPNRIGDHDRISNCRPFENKAKSSNRNNWQHPDALLDTFFSMDTINSSSPFFKLLQYMRCIDFLPLEVPLIDTKHFGRICLPISNFAERKCDTKFNKLTHNLASTIGSDDAKFPDIIKRTVFNSKSQNKCADTSSNFISNSGSKQDVLNVPFDMLCPSCLSHSSLCIRHVCYKSEPPIIFEWGESGKTQPYFTPIQDNRSETRHCVEFKSSSIRLAKGTSDILLHGITEASDAYPYYYKKDILLLSCLRCNNFGIIIPVARCNNLDHLSYSSVVRTNQSNICRRKVGDENHCNGIKLLKESATPANSIHNLIPPKQVNELFRPLKIQSICVRMTCSSKPCQFFIPCTFCYLQDNSLPATKEQFNTHLHTKTKLCKWCKNNRK